MFYQYRITVEGATSGVLDGYPGLQWTNTTDHCEDRGLIATLERRLVTDADILELLTDATGYKKLGNRVVCPWEIVAEMK